jgi:subtilisin-like proprotein convertase family protein
LDFDVKVSLTHTWISDLQLWLVSPSGTEIQLFNRHGESGDDLVNTIFDDAASTLISAGTAPFTGRFRPVQPLSVLNGRDANGNWILRIRDNATDDVGTLTNWSLEITTSPDQVFQTEVDGWVSIDLPSTGTHNIALTDEGMKFTVPSTGKRAATSAGLPHFNQMFGEREIETLILNSYVMHGGGTFTGDNRIDTGKTLAKEGPTAQTLSLANLINTTRGINLVAFDVQDLAGTVTAADFEFRMSPLGAFNEDANPTSGWTDIPPAPTSIVVTPSGANSRITITWSDNVIVNRWLRISVLANANTGLVTNQVYYLGHLRGEVTGAQGGQYIVSTSDRNEIRQRNNPLLVPVTNIYDINKTGRVSVADANDMFQFINTRLRNIRIPASASGMFGSGSDRGFRQEGDDGSKAGLIGEGESRIPKDGAAFTDAFFSAFSLNGTASIEDELDLRKRRRGL